MERFLELMAEILEVEPSNISLNTNFREDCDFDSLKGFSMICTLEEEYEKKITVSQFLKCKTLGDLFNYTK